MRLAYTWHCLRAFRGGYTPLSRADFALLYFSAVAGLSWRVGSEA